MVISIFFRKHPFSVLLFLLISFSAQAQSTFKYTPGAGVSWQSEDSLAQFRILGYVQATGNYHPHFDDANPGNAFFVRRARIDIDFDYLDLYQIFFEFDSRGSRTEMVLAQLDIQFWDKYTLRVGKYITPFSPENYRSSRGLSTIERYNALNSIFLIPALDTQYGVMLFAKYPKFEYYLSLSNGNGKASQNIKESNNAKDFQARLIYNISTAVNAGASFNYAIEETQVLSLVDHQFNSFNSISITGERLGWLGDIAYQRDKWLLRGEAFAYSFTNPVSQQNQARGFWGAYGELGYFLFGNKSDGFQLIGRYERASYIDPADFVQGPGHIQSFLLGHNWYKNGIFRLQTNIIYELTDESSSLRDVRLTGKDHALLVMAMLQLKF